MCSNIVLQAIINSPLQCKKPALVHLQNITIPALLDTLQQSFETGDQIMVAVALLAAAIPVKTRTALFAWLAEHRNLLPPPVAGMCCVNNL